MLGTVELPGIAAEGYAVAIERTQWQFGNWLLHGHDWYKCYEKNHTQAHATNTKYTHKELTI